MNDPRVEAQALFSEGITILTSSTRDLTVSIRKCLLACKLLEWKTQANWFSMELDGYPEDVARPYYRIVKGIRSWQPSGDMTELAFWFSSGAAHSHDLAPDVTSLDVFASLDWVLSAAKSGYTEKTDEKMIVRYKGGKRIMPLYRQKYFTSDAFSSLLATLENKVYSFATSSYVQLKYGDLQSSIWEDYSKKAEQALLSMNLSQHLDGIKRGIESGNPEMLRMAALGCRNLLHDVATFLWKDPRPTYAYLPGDGEDRKLQVTEDKFKNRFSAYLHQKSINGKQRQYIDNNLEYLATCISSLISYQSEGHGIIDPDEARSIAIGTHIIIAELAIWTDLEPVREYKVNNSATNRGSCLT